MLLPRGAGGEVVDAPASLGLGALGLRMCRYTLVIPWTLLYTRYAMFLRAISCCKCF